MCFISGKILSTVGVSQPKEYLSYVLCILCIQYCISGNYLYIIIIFVNNSN